MSSQRTYSATDQILAGLNRAMDTLFTRPYAQRAYPATTPDSPDLTEAERTLAGRYMRVNHVGEVCAQALYHSQAITARDATTRASMEQAANEEIDHLAWCEQRLEELGSRKSYLNPVWYAGSFAIGTLAGIAGDKWNLGFVAETERQVVDHLDSHLAHLPAADRRSLEIVTQMKADEADHAQQAVAAGAADLPDPVRKIMQAASRIMTILAFRV